LKTTALCRQPQDITTKEDACVAVERALFVMLMLLAGRSHQDEQQHYQHQQR
jgi:hypothetical protein